MPEARRLHTGDVVLPVEVGLHVARAAVVPVQRLHGLVDAPPADRRRQHAHRPLALLQEASRAVSPAGARVPAPASTSRGLLVPKKETYERTIAAPKGPVKTTLTPKAGGEGADRG